MVCCEHVRYWTPGAANRMSGDNGIQNAFINGCNAMRCIKTDTTGVNQQQLLPRRDKSKSIRVDEIGTEEVLETFFRQFC